MTLRTLPDLAAAGLLPDAEMSALAPVAERYAVAITPHVAGLIDRADPADPIARQFVPTPAELDLRPEELDDPIGDHAHSAVEGVVHRYPDRVLLKLLHACPVYCRFCFRREMVGPGGAQILAPEALDRALAYIRAHEEIFEVILTGGDPLALAPRRLGEVLAALSEIPHVATVRIHTRVPVVDPARVDPDLLAALARFDGAVWVAIHANHPRELAPEARAALARLARAGHPLVSQTVLLAGVNDDPAVLAELMRAFVANRVKPYYLHHPDLAPGTGHFRVPLARGREIVRALAGRLSGLAQPTYVLDIPGGHGKARVAAPEIGAAADGSWTVEDFRGVRHTYRDSAG